MQLKFTLTPDCLVQGYRLRNKFIYSMLLIWLLFTGSVIFMQVVFGGLLREIIDGSVTSYQWGFFVRIWVIYGFAFGACYAGFFRYVYYPIQIRRHYAQNRFLYGEVELSADDSSLAFVSKHSSISFLWNELKYFKENSKIILIAATKSLHFIVPKTQIEADNVRLFNEYLIRNVRKVRKVS